MHPLLILKHNIKPPMVFQPQLQLTGDLQAPLPQLKIKDHVDHAGLSQLLDLLKEPTTINIKNKTLTLNNN